MQAEYRWYKNKAGGHLRRKSLPGYKTDEMCTKLILESIHKNGRRLTAWHIEESCFCRGW
jgi:hypothetical protein